MPTIVDDFTGSNGSAVNGRTPSGGGAATWTADADYTIQSNQCVRGGSGPELAHIDCGDADHTIEFTLAQQASNSGFLLRYVDDDNWLGGYVINAYVHVVRKVGGVLSDPAFSGWVNDGAAVANGDVISVSVEDVSGTETQVVLSVNGTPVIDKTSSGGTLFPTGTRAGFYCDAGGGVTYDNVTITPLGGGGGGGGFQAAWAARANVLICPGVM